MAGDEGKLLVDEAGQACNKEGDAVELNEEEEDKNLKALETLSHELSEHNSLVKGQLRAAAQDRRAARDGEWHDGRGGSEDRGRLAPAAPARAKEAGYEGIVSSRGRGLGRVVQNRVCPQRVPLSPPRFPRGGLRVPFSKPARDA